MLDGFFIGSYMLSYQHAYHAGNFADVLKHVTLVLIADYMVQKDKPLFYLETHAGRGMYDLSHAMAQKTGEYQQGIAPLLAKKDKSPAVLDSYINRILQLNLDKLTQYPGSPALAIAHLRAIDRLFFCELHPQEFQHLKKLPAQGRRVHSECIDGISMLHALLPPAEKRGLILIDPSYEIKEEYKSIPKAIAKAYERFSQGVYMLWYPLVNPYHTAQLHAEMKKINAKNTLVVEWYPGIDGLTGMTGTGLWIINPPFILKDALSSALTFMKEVWPKSRFEINGC